MWRRQQDRSFRPPRPNAQSRSHRLERLEARELLAVLTWTGGRDGAGVDWHDAANWDANRVPDARDEAVVPSRFNNVRVEQKVNAERVLIEEAATVHLINAVLTTDVDIVGTLNAYGRSSIDGIVKTTASSVINVIGTASPEITRDGLDATLTLTQNLSNSGTLRLVSESVNRGAGDNASLVVLAGALQNDGQVLFATPDFAGTGIYDLDASISNNGRGVLRVESDRNRPNHRIVANLSSDSASHTNAGQIEVLGGDLITVDDATWTNTGDIVIVDNQRFDSGDAFVQQQGVVDVDGILGPSKDVVISGGTVSGSGTIEANVTQRAGIISPGPTYGTLVIVGSLTQSADAVTVIDVGGDSPGQTHDLLQVERELNLDGTLTVNRIGNPSVSRAVVIASPSIRNRFANDNVQAAGFDFSQSSTTVSLASLDDPVTDADAARLELAAGLEQLKSLITDLNAVFDAAPTELPLLPSSATFSGWSNAETQLRNNLGTPTASVANYSQLRAALDSLGFQILCLETISKCDGDSIVEARFQSQTDPISGSLDSVARLADALAGHGISESANLAGVIQATASLTTDITFGVDANGFYITGGSGFGLDVDVQGNLSGGYELPIPGVSISTSGDSGASGNLELRAVAGSQATRRRLTELQQATDAFGAPRVDGVIEVNLGLMVGNGSPTDLKIDGDWTIPIVDSSIGTIDSQLDLPSPEQFVSALAPVFQDGVRTVTDPILSLMDSIPLPMMGGNPSPTNDATGQGLIDDIPVWFDQIKVWLNHKFDYFVSLFEDNQAAAGQGSFYTRGDEQLRARELRTATNATGSGIKIGVISDNVSWRGESLARMTGDLPAATCGPGVTVGCLTVLTPGVATPDGDEGLAMLEIVHDIAPEAQLYFASGGPTGSFTAQAFVGAVSTLAAAGVDIIVDDLYYTEEPFFDHDEGIIANAVSQLIENEDILYVTAAGNETLEHLQDSFRPVNDPLAPAWSTGNMHDWDPGAASRISFPLPAVPIDETHVMTLQWSDTFLNPTQQYLITLVDAAGVPYDAFHPNRGNFTSLPTHFAGPTRPGVTSFAHDEITFEINTPTHIEVAIVEVSADPTKPQPMFELFTSASLNPRNTPLFDALCVTYTNHPACPLENDAIFGQGAVLDVLAVGAINSLDVDTGIVNTTLDTPAPYSMHGGSTVLRADHSGFIALPTLDVQGIDAVEHSHPTGFGVNRRGVFRPFHGSSAAAPHVAAIAALLKQLHPQSSMSDIRSAIEQSAVDIGPAGYDQETGHGRVDAVAAHGELLNNSPVPALPKVLAAEAAVDFRTSAFFDALGVNIESVLSAEQLWDLLQGELDPSTEIVRLSIDLEPTDTAPISAGFGSEWDSDVFGSVADLGLTGKINAELRPDVHFEFGLDGDGFFVHNATQFGALIDAEGTLHGRLNEFEATGNADVSMAPVLRFASGPQRMRLSSIVDHVTNDADLSLGMVNADLSVDLKVGLLDYVEVDNNAANNTENEGDPFVFRGKTNVSANLDSINIRQLDQFEFEFSDTAILNPDIDEDGTDDFTLDVLGDNLIELGKDLLRGERTLFGLEFSGWFNQVVTPLVDNPLGEWLGLQESIDSFLASDEASSDDDEDDAQEANSSIIDFTLPDDLFDDLRGIFDTGLATTPFDLARIVVNLDPIPLSVIDENVNFKLQTILPDSVNVQGRAGIENAHLTGQLVFGIDTSLNPIYLLLQPDALTPSIATAVGGGFDLYVNVSGEPLGGGIVSLDQADARVSPELSLDFSDVALPRLRLGSDVLALRDVNVDLTGEELLQLTAAGWALTPGPFRAAAVDDDENDNLPAVSGAINVYTGQFDLGARRFEASLADALNVAAVPGPRTDGSGNPVLDPDTGQPIIDPGVMISYDPNGNPNQPLVQTRQLQASLDALTVGDPPNQRTPQALIESITVSHAGQVAIPAAEMTIPNGYLNAAGFAGFLPVELNRVRVEFPDPTNLDAMTVCTTGQFLAAELSSQIAILTSTQVTPILQVGNANTSCDGQPSGANQFDFLLNVDSLSEGQIEPYHLGPITLGLQGLQVGGSTLDGQITLGGYQNGQWNSAIDGFFEFQTDANDPSDDDLVDLRIEIDSDRSSLVLNDDGMNLQLTAEAQLTSDIEGPFGNIAAGGSLGFSLGVEAVERQSFPFVEVTDFQVALGELNIDTIEILFDDLIRITADDITLHPNVVNPATDPYGTVGSVQVEILAFQEPDGTPIPGLVLDQTSVALTDVQLFQDELLLSDITFHLDGSFSSGGTTLIDIDDATLRLLDISIPNPFSGTPTEFPSLASFFSVTDTTSPRMEFSLDHAILFPTAETLASNTACETEQAQSYAALCGLSGSFNDTGDLTLVADRAVAKLADVVTLSADDTTLRFGPNVATDEPLLNVNTATVTVPILRSHIELIASDLAIDRNGAITVDAAEAIAQGSDPNTDDGVLNAIGLGDFLPFDITRVRLASTDASPIRLDELTTPNFEIGVAGYFDFALFDNMPAKPVIRMDNTEIQTESDRNTAINPFEFSFLLDENGVAIQDTGLITLGFTDLTVGPLTADAAVTLGRFENGEFETKHLDQNQSLADGVLAQVNIDWDQGNGNRFDFATNARFVGNMIQNFNPTDPDRWTTTLELDGQVGGSVNVAGDGNDAWSFSLEQLLVDFGLEISVDESFDFVTNPSDNPIWTLDGLSADAVEIGLGPFMTMAASNVDVDFSVFRDNVDAPFISFGGQRPTRPQPTANQMFPELDLNTVDGELSVTFGGPLEGLGGKAGNFGIGYNAPDPSNPSFEFPLEFHQLPDFFVALQVPDDFKFGMPDWLPLSVTEIGLRFPDSLGDLLPFDHGSNNDDTSLVQAGLDILTDFSVMFSGGLESREGGWPLQGLVEDVEVNVELLAACAEHVASQVDLNGVPYDQGLAGLSQAVREQGFAVFSSLADCSFPIENLDAVDIGVEPFKLGPVEIGGGLGFGTVDVIDANGDEQEVLFGRVEGQFAYSDVGVGAEVILTEYGPVLARLFAGVPIPIGTLVGALAGSVVPGLGTGVGASLGTQSGFILTGFQGGLVFDGQPLPPINEPLDLLNDPGIRFPLDMNLSTIRDAVQTAVQNDTMTWSNGFTFAASGTLTNIHVHGMVGATVTLGANVGFDPEEILGLAPGTAIPNDAFDYQDEDAGALQSCGQTDLGVVPDLPVGMQLFGFGSLDVLGQSLVDVGLMFDYSDPVNPALYLAGAIPQPGSLLSLIIPGEATAGLQMCTDGLVEGSVLAMQTFVDRIINDSTGYFASVIDELAISLDANRSSQFAQLILNTNDDLVLDAAEANGPLTATLVANRLNALLSGSFGRAAIVATELLQFVLNRESPTVLASRQFLQLAESGNRQANQTLNQVTNTLAASSTNRLQRLIRNTDLTPASITNGNGQVIEQRQVIDGNEASARFTYNFVLQRLNQLLSDESDAGLRLFVADELVGLVQGISPASINVVDAPLPQNPNDPLNLLLDSLRSYAHASISALGVTIVNDPDPFDDALSFQLTQALALAEARARQQVAVAGELASLFLDASDAASEAFFEAIDPSLSLTAEIQPKLFGIEIGEPTDRLDLRLDKSQVHFEFHGSILARLAPILPIIDTFDIFVDIPFENLLRDLFQANTPAIDPDRTLRGGLVGNFALAGVEFADVAGIAFGPVEDANVPGDHPLSTHVQIVNNGPVVGDKILVEQADFNSMRDHGGLLLDGRLTLPSLIVDPFAEIARLQTIQSSLFDELDASGCASLWDCLIAHPTDFFEAASESAAVLGEEQQVAQMQLFMPGDTSQISSEFYVKGQYGTVANGNNATTGKLLGVDLGGALVSYQNDRFIFEQDSADADTDPEIRIEVDQGLSGIPRASLEVSIDTNDPTASPIGNLLDELDFLPDDSPNPGDWLDTGLFDVNGTIEIRGYTPGFEASPTGAFADLKRDGGIYFDANGQVEGYFGELTGEAQFQWTPSDGFSGHFAGSAVVSFPNLLGDIGSLIGINTPDDLFDIEVASVNAIITPSGCVSFYVHQVDSDAQFPLVAGGCNSTVQLFDAVTDEGANAGVKVRIAQLPDVVSGFAKVRYRVEPGSGTAGASSSDYVVPSSREINLNLAAATKDEFGLNFVEGTISIPTVNDTLLEPNEHFFVIIESVDLPNLNWQTIDSSARVLVIDNDEPSVPDYLAPGVPSYAGPDGIPSTPVVFFDFQDNDGDFEYTADPTYSSFDTSPLTFYGYGVRSDDGLADDRAGVVEVGHGARPSLQLAFGARPVFEYIIEPNVGSIVTMIPEAIDFWDFPDGDNENWEVEVEVAGYPVEYFDVQELFTITDDFAPNIHPDLVGWRRLRATIDLVGPDIAFTSTSSMGYVGPITVRLAPQGSRVTGRQIDNVALFGQSTGGLQLFDGLEVELETLLHGRLQFAVSDGPGRIELVDPGNIDPTRGIIQIAVSGTDETSVVSVSVESPNDAVPVQLGDVIFETPLASFEVRGGAMIAGDFTFRDSVGHVSLPHVADGSNFTFLSPAPTVLTVRGDVGTGDKGVNITSHGEINVTAESWNGGKWQVDSINRVLISDGDFTPEVNVTHGFKQIEVRGGDWSGAGIRTGVGERSNGSSGTILVASNPSGEGGNLIASRLDIGGDLDAIETEGGRFDASLTVERLGSLRTQTTERSTQQADLKGEITAETIEVLSTFGGDITADVITRDPRHESLSIQASQDRQGRGGKISSQYSLHIAGGVAEIVADQLNVHLDVKGDIGSIVVAGTNDEQPALVGRLSANRFGEIVVQTGEVQFYATTRTTQTDRPAIDTIRVPQTAGVTNRIAVAGTTIPKIGDLVSVDDVVRPPGDFDGDGRVGHRDLALMCTGLARRDLRFDLTGDGNTDRADLDFLVRNILKTVAGDANLDGVFNSSDLVQIFRAGQYEDRVRGNSRWESGDWNCDGEFTTGDLVDAFMAGGYE